MDQGAASQDEGPVIETTGTLQERFFPDPSFKKTRKRHERYNVSRGNIIDSGRRDPVPNDDKLGEIPPLKSGVPWKSGKTQRKQDATILGEGGKVVYGAKRDWRRTNVQIESPPKTEDSPEFCLVKLKDIQSGIYGKKCLTCGDPSSMEITVIDPRGHNARWLRAE